MSSVDECTDGRLSAKGYLDAAHHGSCPEKMPLDQSIETLRESVEDREECWNIRNRGLIYIPTGFHTQ
jgi:hypothetical protein